MLMCFPTQESYNDQFRHYIETIVPGGALVYNQEDAVLTRFVAQTQNTIRKQGYQTPESFIDNGTTYLETPEGDLISVFGQHNLSNLAGAKWICQLMGIDELDFYEAIESFSGAAKRLEKVAQGKVTHLFKDFAHAPSKVKATATAVAEQFNGFSPLVCLELHTYSSLRSCLFCPSTNTPWLGLDEAIVFYDPEALKSKDVNLLMLLILQQLLIHPNLSVFTQPHELHQYLFNRTYMQSVLLMMSSGNYGG